MKHGINHKLLERSDPAFYAAWFQSISGWASLIRLDSHMDAFAWRVDPNHVYGEGIDHAMLPFEEIGARYKAAGIAVDFIRDGHPNSPDWKALGGDWSSFDPPNTWREQRVPKTAWGKVNTWLTAAAKTLKGTGVICRWQGPNERFDRGDDLHAYDRMKSVYGGASYSRPWTSPAMWGPRSQLMRQLAAWHTMRRYDRALAKPSFLSVNVYPDWQEGRMQTPEENIDRQVENLVLVNDFAERHGYTVTISEFGFASNQMRSNAERVRANALVARCMTLLPRIESACLYWSPDRSREWHYDLTIEELAEYGRLLVVFDGTEAERIASARRVVSPFSGEPHIPGQTHAP